MRTGPCVVRSFAVRSRSFSGPDRPITRWRGYAQGDLGSTVVRGCDARDAIGDVRRCPSDLCVPLDPSPSFSICWTSYPYSNLLHYNHYTSLYPPMPFPSLPFSDLALGHPPKLPESCQVIITWNLGSLVVSGRLVYWANQPGIVGYPGGLSASFTAVRIFRAVLCS